jgi:hypothetical protein
MLTSPRTRMGRGRGLSVPASLMRDGGTRPPTRADGRNDGIPRKWSPRPSTSTALRAEYEYEYEGPRTGTECSCAIDARWGYSYSYSSRWKERWSPPGKGHPDRVRVPPFGLSTSTSTRGRGRGLSVPASLMRDGGTRPPTRADGRNDGVLPEKVTPAEYEYRPSG